MEPEATADLLARLAPSGAEDFITEVFCWILERTSFGEFFLHRLKDGATGLPAIEEAGCSWETQKTYALDGTAKRPDMVCKSADGRSALIFEHKVDANLHDGQLDNYRRIGRDEFEEHGLVLITARKGRPIQDPDRHLLWREVNVWLSEWLGDGRVDDVAAFIARNFLRLLDERGLGPMEQIKADQLQTIPRARVAVRRILSLVSGVADDSFWQELVGRVPTLPGTAGVPLYRQRKPRVEGRCGLYLLGDGIRGVGIRACSSASCSTEATTVRHPSITSKASDRKRAWSWTSTATTTADTGIATATRGWSRRWHDFGPTMPNRTTGGAT